MILTRHVSDVRRWSEGGAQYLKLPCSGDKRSTNIVYHHLHVWLWILTTVCMRGPERVNTGQWLMDRSHRAELVQLRLQCVELCSIVLSLSCIFPQWNDTAAIPVNSFFSSACIHPSQNSTLHTNEVLKHFWSFSVGIELQNHNTR